MKAMILAAGLGTRMRPLTDNCPKPLLKVAGKALIQHHIEKLVSAGIDEIVINHAYLGHMIEEALQDGQQFGCRIVYSAEQQPLETAGGIINALPLLKNGSEEQYFLLLNGDIWLSEEFSQLEHIASKMEKQNLLGHLWLVDNPEHNPQGDFFLADKSNDQLLANVSEKELDVQKELKSGKDLTFAGASILSTALFTGLPQEPLKLAPILKQAMAQQKISGQHFIGDWIDVGTPERLQQVELLINRQQQVEQL